ncbi:hypothetical protein ACTND8_05975 [Atopobiaceae bacterium HCP3S3_F7]|uniref:hypothetical protein n=1 Tax=Collinsella sp. Sow4_D11 TaxID=3438775 RepID=UPI003F8F5190
MSDLNDYLTDEMIEKAAKAIDWKHHEYRVDSRTWIPSCVCGWTATESYDVEGFDRHITETVLLAVVPDIIRKAQAEAQEGTLQRLAGAAFLVDGIHHFHGTQCSCGFTGNARKRTQTEHITAEVLEAYDHD